MPNTDEFRSLATVRVKRDDLLKRVEENRTEHADIFEKSMTGWQEEVTAALKEAYEAAVAGTEYKTHFGLPQPDNHTSDYDHVIAMLKMSQDDELVLTASQFGQFVMDKWEWQAQFLSVTSGYSDAARDKMRRMQAMSGTWFTR